MAKKGNSLGNMFNNAKNRGNNGKDYDVMNPEAQDPNLKNAKKQAGKALLKAMKQVAKAIQKAVQALIKLLLSLRTSRLDNISNIDNCINNCSCCDII